MLGLWSFNQGNPKTTGEDGDEMTKSLRCSWWLPEMVSGSAVVQWVTEVSGLPSMELTSRGESMLTVGIPTDCAKLASMKLSSAPESMRTWRGTNPPLTKMVAGREMRGPREGVVSLTKELGLEEERVPLGLRGHCPMR